MLQKIDLIGNIVADAETFSAKEGREMISFKVAANEKSGEESKVTYYDVRMGKSGILPYLKKGTAVYVSGRLSVSAIAKEGKAYLNASVNAKDVILL